MTRRLKTALLAISMGLAGVSATAADWTVTGPVTAVDSSNAPYTIAFQLGVDAGAYPAGSWLKIAANSVDAPAIHAFLRAASANNLPVVHSWLNSACSVQPITLASQPL